MARGEFLKHRMPSNPRRELKTKMSKVFEEHLRMLSEEMQEILIDDLVTAFQNRIDVLNRAKD